MDQSASTIAQDHFSAPVQLPPFPTGWYCLVPSADLPPRSCVRRRFIGRDVVVFRGASGTPAVLDANCPHMGAHMGYGGVVEGDTLRCPFHGFQFDTAGECVRTPYGTLPSPKCIVPSWPVDEVNGFVFAYHDAQGKAPTWRIPLVDSTQQSRLYTRSWPLASHPQETTENSVDIGHFATVHGYKDFENIEPMDADGPHLHAAYAFTRPAGLFRKKDAAIRVMIEVDVYGLGYSLVLARVPAYGLTTRQWVLPTPTDPRALEFRIALSAVWDEPDKGGVGRKRLPPALARSIIARAAFRGYCKDVSDDFAIWNHKTYVDPPLLAQGDGPIMKYRRWAKQFYA